jgi:hypothetical protein
MNKPSERIVVFVTPAQKRAISATADGLGISISELMRRAVLAFSATSDQVRAASIVDRLNAPREPDALAQVLRKAARPLRDRRASPLRPAASAAPAAPAPQAHSEAAPSALQDEAEVLDLTTNRRATPDDAEAQTATLPFPLATARDVSSAAHEIAQTVARLSAQAPGADAARSDTASAVHDEPLQPLSAESFAHATRKRKDADARHESHERHSGDFPEDGKFA